MPGRTKISEVTNEVDDEETSLEEERIEKKRVLNLINKIERGGERIWILRGELRLRDKGVAKKRIQEKILKKQTKIFDAFKQINLREKQISRIVQKLKQWDIWMEKSQKDFKKYEENLGMGIREARKTLRMMRKKAIKGGSLWPAKVGLKLKDLEEMDRISRNVKKKVNRMGGRLWPFFGSAQRCIEGD